MFITSLRNSTTAQGMVSAAITSGRLRRRDLVAFFRSLATLVGAGVPLRRSLDVTLEQCGSGRLREALCSVISDIESGLPLSSAIGRRPKEFSALFVTTIRAGETGGVLDEILERIATTMERDSSVRKRVAATLVYPGVVASSALALVFFLITTIVPSFRSLYDQMHVPIPPVTAALLTIGTALRQPVVWLLPLPLLIGIVVLLRVRASGTGATLIQTALMRAPFAGTILTKITLARLSRVLGVLIRSGVGLVEALEATRDVISSPPYRNNLAEMRHALAVGSSITASLTRSGLYEPMFVQMVRVGEETGALDAMLLRIADYYDLDVETALNALGSVIEPLMILLLGTAVGFIVAAVFIPLYSLIGSIR